MIMQDGSATYLFCPAEPVSFCDSQTHICWMICPSPNYMMIISVCATLYFVLQFVLLLYFVLLYYCFIIIHKSIMVSLNVCLSNVIDWLWKKSQSSDYSCSWKVPGLTSGWKQIPLETLGPKEASKIIN